MLQGKCLIQVQSKWRLAACFCVSLAILGLSWASFLESAQAAEPALDEHYEQKPITVTVSKTLYLPPDMYGQWSVTGEMLDSNAPEQFSSKLSDIWILEREGDQVIVSNPATGA